MSVIATFSIAAYDPETQEWGVAVQSKFLAAGNAVPWVKAGAGAIATQAECNLDFGELGLQLLAKGYTAEKVKNALLALDDRPQDRQFGIVDSYGNSAAYTGSACFNYAGHRCGKNYTCQGNILVNKETVDAMAESFENSTGSLARRLVQALAAAQTAGGDSRGRQAAAVYIAKANASYGNYNDKEIDLRVDDDPEPIAKLSHLLDLHELYFGRPEEILPIDPEMAVKIQQALKEKGYYKGEIDGVYGPETESAYRSWCGVANYEMRFLEGPQIDARVYPILLIGIEK